MADPSSPAVPPRPRRSRIAGFRRSVVVTVASGATAVTGGCLSREEVTVNPPAPGFETEDSGVQSDDCPPPAEVVGACDQPGRECIDGQDPYCNVPTTSVCQDGVWEPIVFSCNPPLLDAGIPDVWTDDASDGCPPPADVDGTCLPGQQGLECPTGRQTGCGEDQIAACEDGYWDAWETTCNPPFLEDAGIPDATPEDAGKDAGKDAGGPFGDGVPYCPAGTELPKDGASCNETTDCHLGGCVLDWNTRITCAHGQWKLRLFNCWSGEWGPFPGTAEDDGGTTDG